MVEIPVPCAKRAQTGLDAHPPDTARAPKSADLLESAMWPYLPRCAARALSVTLLLTMAAGVLAAFTREVHAQSAEVLLSNGEPPPSARLLLVIRPARVRTGTDGTHGGRAGGPRCTARERGDAHPAPVGSHGGTARGHGGDGDHRQRRSGSEGMAGALRADRRVARRERPGDDAVHVPMQQAASYWKACRPLTA